MRFLPALIVDALLVLVFAAIGRASHAEDPLGFLLTAWPFLVGLLLGHGIAALLPGRPRRPWGPAWGAVVWMVTVAGGMLLRVATGDTAQLPFLIVATLTLGVFLLGWRGVTALIRRRGTGGPTSPDAAGSAVVVGAGAHDPRQVDDGHDGRARDAETEADGADLADGRAADGDGSDGGGSDSGGGSESGGSDGGGGAD